MRTTDLAFSAAHAPWRRPWRALQALAAAALLAAAYYAGIQLGFILRFPDTGFSALWPPIAVLLPALLLTPASRWWLWIAAAACAHLAFYVPLATPLWRQAVQLSHSCLMVLIPAILIRRYLPHAMQLTTFSGALTMLAVVASTAMVVPLASAAIYVATGVASSFGLMWQLIAFSNVLAYLTLFPAILLAAQHGRAWLRQATLRRVVEAYLLAVLLLAASSIVFGRLAAGPGSGTYIRMATLPLLLWIAVRFGPGGLSLGVTAMTLIALWSGSLGLGPFTAAAPNQNIFDAQSYFLTFAAPLLLLAALMGDRRRAELDLKKLNTELEQRVALRTAELAVARDQAEAANRAKSDFVATMSHELRTPMNAVIGMTTLLLASPLSSAQRSDVETIRRSGNMLLTLINDVLDFSKIDAHKLTLEYHPFALRACIEEALDLLAPLADAKHLALHYAPNPALPEEFLGDPARLRQVLVNLLSNAVRFTERGTITVTLGGAPGTGDGAAQEWDLRIAVHDTGIGIAPGQLAHIFQPFSQVDVTAPQGAGGTGLGLTISRRLAELMGGQITVASTLGAGSTFTLALRLEATVAPLPAYLAPAQPLLAGKRALLVADDAAGAPLVSQLEHWQLAVTRVAGVADAVTWLAHDGRVDVVVLDRRAPGTPLGEQVAALRAAAQHPAPPLIASMAVSEHEAAGDGSSAAPSAVVLRPVHPSALYTALLQVLVAASASATAHLAGEIDATLGQRHPLRILLAEDNTTNQEVARRLLGKLGYAADAVTTGLDVLEALRRQDYDLVLMDVQMPEMSGTEATHYIRTFWPPARQPRIAAMTAYASEENRAWLLTTGMDDYVRKPVRVDDLKRALLAAASAQTGVRPPTTAETIVDEPLDLRLLATFLESIASNDPAADSAFVDDYLADMGGLIEQLRLAVAGDDHEQLGRAAHTLEGLSVQVGARDLAILCRRIKVSRGSGSSATLLDQAAAAYTALRRTIADRPAAGIPNATGGVR